MEQKDEISYIERICNGETQLFSLFLDRYGQPIHRLVVQIVSCREDAEEIVQDIFLKSFRHLNRYKGECSFSTWLYRIAYNTAISAVRKKKREFLYIDENVINNVPDEKTENLFSETDDENKITLLMHAIDRLDADEKGIITLFYYEEEPAAVIAEIMKLSVSNVKVKLHRIRKKLFLLMEEKV